ncbi:MAG: transglutaminase domain-containing protein, partial [Myxococcaceae bacterium]
MVRVLTGLLASAALAANPAAAGVASTAPTPLVAERGAPGLDMAAIRERTRIFEAAKAQHRAQTARLSFTDEVGPLLQAAQSKTGAPPSSLGRLSFPAGVSAARRAELYAAQGELEQAVALLDVGRAKALAHLDAVEASLSDSPQKGVLLARLAEQRRQLEERSAEAKGLASGASADLSSGDGLGDRALHYVLQLSSRDAATALSRLQGRLEEWGALRASPILGAELTYVNGPLTPAALPATQVTPAYLAGGASGLSLEDTTQGREVELSPEVMAKAQSLATAKAAYDFVRNEVKLDWYYGSLKGSTETLREGRGNDADLSALLIALLRAQGRPARYVRGTIELPVARLSELMGLLDAAQADALYARGPGAVPFALPPAIRDRALQALSAAGVPYQPVQSGGQVTAVQLSHVWVEAYLPYADYRGVGEGTEGRQWVPLEPAIPGSAKYAATPPVLDALLEMQATPASLTDAYLTGTRGATSALDFYRSRVSSFLAQSRPDVFYPQTLRTVQQRNEPLSLIPGTLPYKVVSVHEEAAFLPDSAKHRLRVVARDGAGAFVDVTLPLHQVVGHRAIFGYKPATQADEEAVQLAGGLYLAPASIVEVLAVVRVDGRELAVASRAVGLGVEHDVSVELLLPDGSSRRLDNRLIAGNFVALGLGGPVNGFVEAAQDDGADLDGPAPRFLYARAAVYANAWTEAEEELARLLQVVPVRPTANVAFVQNQLAVDQVLGIRKQGVWKGLEVDADLRTMVPLELVPGRAKALLRLSGYEGSYQEAKVLSQGSGEEAVSAVGVIQEANARNAQVLLITSANATVQLPLLNASSEVLRDVEDMVARGREVLIPAAPLAIRDWTGIGFIARDPQSEEAGYFLSGRLSGGQTVVSPRLWADEELVRALQGPDAPKAVTDPALAAQILKVVATDLQSATVGTVAPLALAVVVLTADGRPVADAGVTFFGASPFDGLPGFAADAGTLSAALDGSDAAGIASKVHALPQAVTVATNGYGQARIWVTPDPIINAAAIEQHDSPNTQLLGLGQVSAQVGVGGDVSLRLREPFFLVGLPDVPAKMSLGAVTDFQSAPVALELGIQLPAWLTDRFGNYLANRPVVWAGAPDTGRFVDPARWVVPRVLRWDEADPLQLKSLTQLTSTYGEVVAEYVVAPTPGQYELSATSGAVAGRYHVGAVEPAEKYAFRLAVSGTPDGIYRTSHPEPRTAQILRFSASDRRWTPIRGDEPEIERAVVQMRVRDVVATSYGTLTPGKLLLEETAIPKTSDGGLDDDVTAFFWPKYLVDGPDAGLSARQYILFTAEVKERDAGSPTPCSDSYYLAPSSGTPRIETLRLQPGGTLLATDACGRASTSDEALVVRVTNPADYPIYLQIDEVPKVSGEALVVVSPPSSSVRHPDDINLIRVLGAMTKEFHLWMKPGTHGGKVRFTVKAPDPAFGAHHLVVVAENETQILPDEDGLATSDKRLVARVILPVRNFESSAVPDAGQVAPASATEPPLIIPANLTFCAYQSGTVTVTSGTRLLAGGEVTVDSSGARVTASSTSLPTPEVTADGALSVVVPPGHPGGQKVAIEFTPLGGTMQRTEMTLSTITRDIGALPVGHLFVKDVSVTDGHVAKQFEDLRVTGRGPPLAFSRSFTSQGLESSPLGMGWSHSYRSFVLQSPGANGAIRYAVVGGEGTGQVFTCGIPCKPQRGFHGTLSEEAVQAGQTSEQNILFRSKGGVVYRYGPLHNSELPRHRLLSITEPSGNSLELEYGGVDVDGEVTRVHETGTGRFLRFTYERPPGGRHLQLSQVHLRKNRLPVRPAKTEEGLSLGVCVKYGYDAHDMLVSAKRFDGDCDSGEVLRSESFEYDQTWTWDEATWNNLTAFTDASGVTTRYEYFGPGDTFPGESAFVQFAEKSERVKRVVEPLVDGGTTFAYGLQAQPVLVAGGPLHSFKTQVTGPRPGVTTTYDLEGYGSAVRVRRPLNAAGGATTQTLWDSVHQRPKEEYDARGRVTKLSYDDFGNLVERRTLTPVLAGDAGPTEAPTDGLGAQLAEVVERWGYEPSFGQLVCHVDAEGYVTRYTVDSNGARPDRPDAGVPTGTGLRLSERTMATRVPANLLVSDAGCVSLTPATDGADIVKSYRYCQVAGFPCPQNSNAKKGDLLETIDGEGNTSSALAFDALGNATQSRLTSPAAVQAGSSATLVTNAVYDGLGRLTKQTDTAGHHLEKSYDGLDRPTVVARFNTRAAANASPAGVKQTFEYFPGGQVKAETNGLGLVRRTELDGRGRPVSVTETDGGLPAALTTRYEYDEAGNRTAVTDRRGVTTLTSFDFADRPIELSVEVRPADAQRYAAQSGEAAAGRKVIASYGYDEVGNKLFETDLHGHRTSYVLDSLYRVVKVEQPQVPGATPTASAVVYETVRRYDRRGSRTYEKDGNNFVSTWTYDFAGRLVATEDAVGRVERRAYDKNGNLTLETKESGAATHLKRTTGPYDALKRPLAVAEEVTGLGGVRTTLSSNTIYDDVNHTVATKDFRGFVTLRRLDDLDRVFEQVVDSQSTNPPRSPDVPAPPLQSAALEVKTAFEYDAAGNRSATVDPLLRRTEESYDGLGRVTSRSLPMGVSESFTYDGEGRVISQSDRRGVVRKHTFDVLGRPKSDVLVESIS